MKQGLSRSAAELNKMAEDKKKEIEEQMEKVKADIDQDQKDLAASTKRDVATIAAEEEMIANSQNRLPRDLETVVEEEDVRTANYEKALAEEIDEKKGELEELDQKKKDEEELIEARKE